MGSHLRLYDGLDLSIDQRVEARYCVCGQVHLGLTVDFFTPVFSCMYC